MSGEDLPSMGVGRCELVEGRIVPMSPTNFAHGDVEGNFYDALRRHAQTRKLGKVLVGEVGVYTRRDPDTVRGADVLFISNERFARVSKDKAFLDVAPELVVEVLSPEDRAGEVARKLGEYFDAGVLLVWLADPQARTVTVYRSLTDVQQLRSGDSLEGGSVLPGFAVPVASLSEA